MNIQFEKPDKTRAEVTLTIEEADFKDDLEKALKNYRKQVEMPGFRKGMVPMPLIKKQYGAALKMNVMDKKVGGELMKYLDENEVAMLGHPLPSEKQEPVDLEKEPPYVFIFDIALEPELNVELTDKDTVNYFKADINDEVINARKDNILTSAGKFTTVEKMESDRDILKGDLRELDAEGNTVEGGLVVDGATVMPAYLHDDDQKKLFENAKLGDIITFCPSKAYPDNDNEVAALLHIAKAETEQYQGDFSFQITEISHFQKAEPCQEAYDKVYGPGVVNSEEEFTKRVTEDLEKHFSTVAEFLFSKTLREYAMNKAGELEFADDLLKKMLTENAPDNDPGYVEIRYNASKKALAWQLVRTKLINDLQVEMGPEDVEAVAKEYAREQFARYGMKDVPDEHIENYAHELFKKKETMDQILDITAEEKLAAAAKKVVKLNEQTISAEDFNNRLDA